MLYSEFFERTGVSVEPKEYAAIEECYYHFPGNKDEFCVAWSRMNSKRVKAAKDARKDAEKKAKQKERLFIIMNRMDKKVMALRYDYSLMPISINFLSVKDQKLLENLGIYMRLPDEEAVRYGYHINRHKRIDETAYDIKKYLNIA